ncbi:hypothetical protein ACFLW6_03400, partial [Chloroflexota bacterium]
RSDYSANVISNYINLFDVQEYLTAMAAGACQKNISQPNINNLPIPECLITGEANIEQYFDKYEHESLEVMATIAKEESILFKLKSDISKEIKTQIIKFYS